MEKRRSATILDNILLVIGIWLLSYLWVRYYVMNLLVALTAASGIAMCVIMLINIKRQKNKIKLIKQKRISNIMNQFLYGGKEFTLNLIYSSLRDRFGMLAQKHDSFISVKKTAIIPKLNALALSFSELIDCYVMAKSVKAKHIIILTLEGGDKLCKANLSRLPDVDAEIFDKTKSYDFLGWLDSLPEISIEFKAAKRSPKKLLVAAFSPKKFKHYLTISIILMLSSYFALYPIYYIVFASITLVISLLCKFNIAKKLSD